MAAACSISCALASIFTDNPRLDIPKSRIVAWWIHPCRAVRAPRSSYLVPIIGTAVVCDRRIQQYPSAFGPTQRASWDAMCQQFWDTRSEVVPWIWPITDRRAAGRAQGRRGPGTRLNRGEP
jgi:hypothetical protein